MHSGIERKINGGRQGFFEAQREGLSPLKAGGKKVTKHWRGEIDELRLDRSMIGVVGIKSHGRKATLMAPVVDTNERPISAESCQRDAERLNTTFPAPAAYYQMIAGQAREFSAVVISFVMGRRKDAACLSRAECQQEAQ